MPSRSTAGDAGRGPASHADPDRLRRDVAGLRIVRDAGLRAEHPDADCRGAKIGNPHTAMAHERAAGEIRTRCRHVIDLT